ncbi:MAG: hypothetical protein JJU46_03180 [Balneolaceae bacterium]|nr:hypothetical protein [Balneolaceae bacterium]MCH8549877.1 hypothetical protein [Balneolaceae bacterium]
MIAERYEAVNMLNMSGGKRSGNNRYPITPIRFVRKNGSVHHIDEIRVVHREYKGGKVQYNYNVKTRDGKYCHLLFDIHSLTWRLVEMK